LTGYCRLAGIFAGALDGFLEHLDRYTLADLVPDARPALPSSTKVTMPRRRDRPSQR
jgi:Rrf2 family nitric oxide-sensitive transcriptional repressor